MDELYKQLEELHQDDRVALLNAVAREYQKAKASYNFGDISTWKIYLFWRGKYESVHYEVASNTRIG